VILSGENTYAMKKYTICTINQMVFISGAAGAFWNYKYVHKSAPSAKTSVAPSTKEQPTYVEQVLAKMSLRDKVASLFIFHAPGTDPAGLASYLSTYKPSGLILMDDNIPYSFTELRAETAALVTDKQLPPLIAIDEEGDTVSRLAADTFPGALTLRGSPPSVTRTTFEQRSDLLKSLGINLNFGIIADVTTDPNSFIYPRVLGTTPEAASERVAEAVAGSKGKTLSTIKHFPGHGETEADSHNFIPTATTSFADWQQRVAPPFQAGINAGADMVMFGQLRYSAVDAQPATLSKKWHDIIRNQLGFKGVIITDDMIMLQNSGEATYTDPVANAVAGVEAGNDLLLYVLDHGTGTAINPNMLIDGVVAAVLDGRISASTIDEHVEKVLTLRHQLGESLYVQ
jgi:beta-N-acetylhexosaminidase